MSFNRTGGGRLWVVVSEEGPGSVAGDLHQLLSVIRG